jgi:hypothetical protein
VFWTDEDPMAMRQIEPAPQPQQRQKKPRRAGAKIEKQIKEKEYAKPVGSLVITISIEQQKLRVYDANGLFAETSVSTGTRGHSTPMGVFSIIQKNKYHRSNIYSGAPMPFMQRITWSGIALHAGVLPGYPASHGCIRMPMAFATKIWGWTRMGARVIITPGEISPTEFSHPLLATAKPAPTPTAALQAKDVVTTAKADKAPVDVKPVDLGLKPSTETERAKTQTADASGAITPAASTTPVMSDATPAKSNDAKLMTRRDLDTEIAKTVELPAPAAKPAETVAEATTKVQPASIDARKDETRPAYAFKDQAKDTAKDAAKPEVAAAPAAVTPAAAIADTTPKRTGQIAVLISGKDGKLYVRQNFAPLFETSIAIKPSDRPLGTHIFTARVDKGDAKDDSKTFRWTAVSLPSVPRRAEEDDRTTRRRKTTGAIEVKPRPLPDSAAEALDRLTIPADVMAQIADALATGGSIVVSDQGIAAGGETGQGTEFVVPLR